MRKILMVLIICVLLSSCKAENTSALGLDEVSELVFNRGYGAEDVLEIINGVYYEDLAERWGDHGELSGLWGDIWSISDGERKKQIIVYYNSGGFAEHIIIDDVEEKETDKSAETNNMQTDENGYYVDDDVPIYEEEWYLDDVLSLIVSEGEDYNSEIVLKMLTERDFHCEELRRHWGTPNGTLFGAWGDIWELENGKKITVYYSGDGYVENVIMDNNETDIDGNV